MMYPKTIWFTGLSASGKSTLANAVKNKLDQDGHSVKLFDGDEIRKGLNKDLDFSLPHRFENIRRVAEVNKLFLDFGISTINAFISPTDEIRNMARSVIGDDRFLEICLTTPLEVCMSRDPKGFYKRIKTGGLKDFTGIDSVFEPSTSAALYLDTSKTPLEECVEMVTVIFHKDQITCASNV